MRKLAHRHWHSLSKEQRMLRVIQPFLTGFIDGSLSTLAPVFAIAYAVGADAAFLVGMAASFGAALSMGISEGMSDNGELTGRGRALTRGIIIGCGTFVGGMGHVMPFLIDNTGVALLVAYPLVLVELLFIAYLRKKYQEVGFFTAFIQVTLAGIIIGMMGVLIGTHG